MLEDDYYPDTYCDTYKKYKCLKSRLVYFNLICWIISIPKTEFNWYNKFGSCLITIDRRYIHVNLTASADFGTLSLVTSMRIAVPSEP